MGAAGADRGFELHRHNGSGGRAVGVPAGSYTRVWMTANPTVVALARATRRVPGLRRLPVLKLLALGEIVLLARDHYERLTPAERRRLVILLRRGRGRPSNLSRRDRHELSELIAKVEPRVLAGAAADKLSPVPLPDRVVTGKKA